MKIKLGLLNQANGRFVGGFLIASLIFGGVATALGPLVSDNTPENGYLLCANKKTKAVTFPGTLKCPSGTKVLDLGAVIGNQGPTGFQGFPGANGAQGPAGPAGPAGPGSSLSKLFSLKLAEKDVVFDGNATSSFQAKRFLMGVIDGRNLESGIYFLNANLSGLWSSTAYSKNPIVECFFQDKVDYDAYKIGGAFGSRRHGGATQEYGAWNGIDLNIFGDKFFGPTTEPIYLVCSTTGSISGMKGMVFGTKHSDYGDFAAGTST